MVYPEVISASGIQFFAMADWPIRGCTARVRLQTAYVEQPHTKIGDDGAVIEANPVLLLDCENGRRMSAESEVE